MGSGRVGQSRFALKTHFSSNENSGNVRECSRFPFTWWRHLLENEYTVVSGATWWANLVLCWYKKRFSEVSYTIESLDPASIGNTT